METDQTIIIKDIESDPKLLLLAKAINELSEQNLVHEVALKTVHAILIDQQKSILTLNESLKKVGEAVDVIIKQMFVTSHNPAMPLHFKGLMIK